MASATIPVSNQGNTYTIVTQVIPSSTALTTAQQPLTQQQSHLRKFLKGEPKALGTVQIVLGVVMIMLGIVISINSFSINTTSGITFWGSLLHISCGSLAVSGSNKLHICVVKSALVLNIINTITAGIAIIIFSLDIVIMPRSCYNSDYYDCRANLFVKGIFGIQLVLCLFQFCISIALSAFSCKATCTNEPTLNIINVVPIHELSAQQPQLALNAIATGGPSLDNPPAYSEKSLPDH